MQFTIEIPQAVVEFFQNTENIVRVCYVMLSLIAWPILARIWARQHQADDFEDRFMCSMVSFFCCFLWPLMLVGCAIIGLFYLLLPIICPKRSHKRTY